MDFVQKVGDLIPFLVPFYAIAYALLYSNSRAMLFFFGAVGSDLFNALLKEAVQPACRWAGIEKACLRPLKNASCSIWGRNFTFDVHKQFGMPSGHAQFAGFMAGYWIPYLNYYRRHWPERYWLTALLLLVLLFTMYSRVHLSRCHTWLQVCLGALLGLLLGYAYYRFGEWYMHTATSEPSTEVINGPIDLLPGDPSEDVRGTNIPGTEAK